MHLLWVEYSEVLAVRNIAPVTQCVTALHFSDDQNIISSHGEGIMLRFLFHKYLMG